MRATPLAAAVASVMAWLLLLGVLVDRAELFVAAIPLAVGLLGVAARTGAQRFELRQQVSSARVGEGDRIVVSVGVAATDPIPMMEILAALPPLIVPAGNRNRAVLKVEPGRQDGWSFAIRCPARGHFDLGTLHVRLWDRSGMAVCESRHAVPLPISVFPQIAMIRQAPQPVQTRFSFGNYISPRLGEGIEPGEIRPFLPGDRTRRINWRASLRRQQLYVTQYHEERNADIVLLLDALCDIGARPYSTLDLSVRAMAALAHAYVARKDRVGLVEFGGYLRWINPATGQRQYEALIEGMLPAATHFSYVVPQLGRLPRRILPPDALVIAVTPLLDDRFLKALADLMARGFDVIVLAVSPIEPARRVLGGSLLDEIGCRYWAMEWQDKADALRRQGLAIVEWQPQRPLDTALAPLIRSRPRGAARR